MKYLWLSTNFSPRSDDCTVYKFMVTYLEGIAFVDELKFRASLLDTSTDN
jgi:hypothetical protein